MPFKTENIFPLSGLNKDSAYHLFKPGEYPDALDITHIGELINETGKIHNILGNQYATVIPEISTIQNKIYRVSGYAGAGGAGSYTLVVFDMLGGSVSAVFAEGATLQATIDNAKTAINATLAAVIPPQSATYTEAANDTSFTIEITTVTGYDFIFTSATLTLTIIQEAYDTSLIGEANIIGGYDLLGDLFLWSTTQRYLLTSELRSIVTSNNGSGLIRLTFDDPHNLTTGQKIKISEATGTTPVDGLWIITVISATVIDLENSNFTTHDSTEINLSVNIDGIGEIGVAQKDNNSGTWTYRRLIRSKELNFRRPKQITGAEMQKVGNKISSYWTDDFNFPRVAYYFGEYLTDGFIESENPANGKYQYGTIATETKLTISLSGAKLDFVEQLETGGNLIAGNKRYIFRMLGDSLVATQWSDLSNPVSVTAADNSPAYEVLGSVEGAITTKQNVLKITDIPSGLYKYIELGVVEYIDDLAISGKIVTRKLLGDLEDIQITHSGNETDSIDLDLTTIGITTADYVRARNMNIIDKRMVLSNVATQKQYDLNTWAQSIEYSLKRFGIDYVGDVLNITFNEYMKPENVFRYVGYMDNETYRFSIKLKYKNGGWTQNYWVDDILFDCNASGRKIAGLPDFTFHGLAPPNDDKVMVRYIEFTSIDFDYVMEDGNRIRDVFEEIAFERAECIKEVMATGALILSEFDPTVGTPVFAIPKTYYLGGAYSKGSTSLERRIGLFHSMDEQLGNETIVYQLGDKLKTLGCPNDMTFTNYLNDYTGDFNALLTSYDIYDLQQSVKATTGGTGYSLGTATVNMVDDIVTPTVSAFKGILLLTSTAAINPPSGSGQTDQGIYYVQWFRDKGGAAKYGNKETTQYISCGHSYKITENSNLLSTTDVFGGDTFTQKVYVHAHKPLTVADTGGGYGFYVQNRVNAQMRNNSGASALNSAIPGLVVASTMAQKVLIWTNYTAGEQRTGYSKQYDIRNEVQVHTAFDENAEQVTERPHWIVWSDLKPGDSTQDAFRIFFPLNFHALDLIFGAIIHQDNGNGELLTWQPRKFMRQYFNTRGTLDVRDIGSVLIGDGSVMQRDGQTISVIGCNNKFSVIKGKSEGGNDVFIWINTELKKAVRFGYDGTKPIGDIEDMQAFFANNLRWVHGKDNPADGQGICGVWDDRHKEFTWTFRGHKIPDFTWADGDSYTAGQSVFLGDEANFTTFEQTIEIYECIANHTAGATTKPGVGASWQTKWKRIAHTDTDYFNEYSLVYNEQKNRFTSPYTPKPLIYLKWADHYLSPRPVSDTGEIYEHGKGIETTWYDDGNTKQESEAFIELLFAKDVNLVKEFIDVLVSSKIVPKKISFFTDTHETFVVAADFESDLNKYTAPIKNDIISSSDGTKNDEDTSNLWGEWVRMRIYFETGVKQQLSALVLKYFYLSRTYNK